MVIPEQTEVPEPTKKRDGTNKEREPTKKMNGKIMVILEPTKQRDGRKGIVMPEPKKKKKRW